ncbi:LolA family protein [Sulfoacidibacillus thermotolerans]|uniref:LolA family protein n=1 Tax=Sulfoacidibacillus thermotolerans TaxID=1765684 RepID=UPI0015E7F682|nr:outer membrane lipoprotein carrier protein LolA [Sulfoacidibacillus thermotolerans]
MSLALVLSGCGQMSATQMAKQLQSVQNNLTTYKSEAFMTVHVQDSVQRYYVETWYQAPNLYRIALGNENKEISQIILHNAQGIYIISPSTRKVIRFQGDWAEKQGQMYLYSSLLSKIVSAVKPGYSVKDKVVTFVVAADSSNALISSQKIELDQATFHPIQVVLYDQERRPVITLNYISFKKGVQFPPNAFSPDQATTLKSIEVPVSAIEQGFGVIEPSYIPQNDNLEDEAEQGGVVFVRYAGPEPFTLVETRPTPGSIELGSGQLLTLYGLPAVLTGNVAVHQLYWLEHGVEFQLTSHMPIQQMVRVAASMVDEGGK